MPDIAFNRQSIAQLKAAAHAHLPQVKSSHLAEALAAAFGFKTNAALLAQLDAASGRDEVRKPDALAFVARVQSFGYDIASDFVLISCAQRFGSDLFVEGSAAEQPEVPAAPVLGNGEFDEPALFNKSDAERCWSYGVRIETEAAGRVWAKHPFAGVLGPFGTEDQAAREACRTWDL